MIGYFVILILVITLLYFIVSDNQPKLAVVKYGHVVDGFNTKSLVVRDERIIKSPLSGTFYPLCKEGKRLSYGQPVARLKNEEKGSTTLYNKMSGIVSFSVDGLENKITPGSINKININEFYDINRNYKHLSQHVFIRKNEYVYRVINNYNMYLVIKTSQTEAERYRINETVFARDLEFDSNKLIEAKITNIIEQNKKALIVLKLDRFISRWLDVRWVDIEFIKNIYRGRVIPANSVIGTAEGKKVIVSDSDSDYKLKKIDVKYSGKNQTVVQGIEVGTNVVIDPAKYNITTGGNNNEKEKIKKTSKRGQ